MKQYLSTAFGIGACLIGLSLSNVRAEDKPTADAKSGTDAAKAMVLDTAAPGRKLFLSHKCTQCHSIDALKIAKVKSEDNDEATEDEAGAGKKVDPPDLSGVGKDRSLAWIIKWQMKDTTIEGRHHKKKFKGSDEDLKTLSGWLVNLKFDVPKKKANAKEADEKAKG